MNKSADVIPRTHHEIDLLFVYVGFFAIETLLPASLSQEVWQSKRDQRQPVHGWILARFRTMALCAEL